MMSFNNNLCVIAIKTIALCVCFGVSGFIQAQNADSIIKEGISAYCDGEYSKAFTLFQQASKTNNGYGNLFLGWCYEQGKGAIINPDSAVICYEKAASLNIEEACSRLGLLYINGIGVKRSEKRALIWYERGLFIEENSYQRAYNLALGTTWEFSLADLKIPNADNILSTEILSRLYYSTRGLDKKEREDKEFKGYNMYHLARCYEWGIGGCKEIDCERAIYWYKKSLQNPNVFNGYILFRLGYLHHKGHGTKKDDEKAISWLMKGMRVNDPTCLIMLGWMYDKGLGVKTDKRTAEKFYSQAKVQSVNKIGGILAYRIMEEFFSQEKEYNDSWENALYWGEVADNKKYASLQGSIIISKAVDYLKEDSVNLQMGITFLGKQDYRKAAYYLHLAAGNNNPMAQKELALLYEKGLGVGKNIKIACDWYGAANRFGIYKLDSKIDSLKHVLDTEECKNIVRKKDVAVEKKRIALVIGNAQYASQRLESLNSPLKDADDISAKLSSLGFDVKPVLKNSSKKVMMNAIKDFIKEAENKDVALFYYSGHGIQDKAGMYSKNYLIPTDAKLQYRENLAGECVDLNDMVIKNLNKKCKASIIFVDACRTVLDLPSESDLGEMKGNGRESRGLSEQRPPKGVCVVYATSADNVAYDPRQAGKNSYFTQGLLDCLNLDADKHLGIFIQNLKMRVDEITKGEQHPTDYNELFGDFYFDPNK